MWYLKFQQGNIIPISEDNGSVILSIHLDPRPGGDFLWAALKNPIHSFPSPYLSGMVQQSMV
jgi:hypothetical protein